MTSAAAALAVWLLAASAGAGQTAPPAPQAPAGRLLDGVAAIVNGEVITRSQVAAMRQLRLDPLATLLTDDGVVRFLIYRRLELAEVRRFAPPEPAAEAIAARRRQWESQLPAGTNASTLLSSTFMDEAALTAWFRDDVRIDGYLQQKFGAPDDRRRARVAAWLDSLYERAEVSINIR